MSETEPMPSIEPTDPSRTGRGRTWLAIAAVVVAVSGLVAVVALLADSGGETGSPIASPTVATSVVTSPTATTTAVPSTTLAPNQPTAADTLGPYFAAAIALDKQLHNAATMINGSGPPWAAVSDEIANAVQAAGLAPVAKAIPAGLPPDLRRSVILVYSDLASRRFAMADFEVAGTVDPGAYPNSDDRLQHLGNSHAAAVRFSSDLAAARSLAAATPAVSILPTSSRQAAEVTLYTRYVEISNGGCGTRGGKVVTQLPDLVWDGLPGRGTVGGIGFTANLGPDNTWHINLLAC